MLTEAARVLRPGGRLLVADFAPHGLEFLRAEHAHRRLGFDADEVRAWCESAGLPCDSVQLLEPDRHTDGESLTVTVWCATRPALDPRITGPARAAEVSP